MSMTPLTEEEIKKALSNLEGWKFDSNRIRKEFQFGNFKEALGFIIQVGFEAERLAHHPELFNVYNTVKIELSTHDADDKVTQNDIDLATAIEKIV